MAVGMDFLKNNIDYYKTMVKDLGVIEVAYMAGNGNVDTYHHGEYGVNHCVAIVGWDDDYVLHNSDGSIMKDENGNELKGAWIVRNSWGDKGADGGYLHISYKDSSLQAEYSMQQKRIQADILPLPLIHQWVAITC
jgi:C1A family cysteine protease